MKEGISKLKLYSKYFSYFLCSLITDRVTVKDKFFYFTVCFQPGKKIFNPVAGYLIVLKIQRTKRLAGQYWSKGCNRISKWVS